MINNKKGMSFMEAMIFGLMALVGLTIMYIFVFNTAIIGYLLPAMSNIVSTNLSPTDATTVLAGYASIKNALKVFFISMFCVVIIFLGVHALRREQDETIVNQ